MDNDMNLCIDFSDITMASSDGDFKSVSEIMESEFMGDKDWMIRSFVTISSNFGIGKMNIDFFQSGDIVIVEYDPSVNDVYYNPDIRALCSWAQEAGWKVPQPHIDLIHENKDFWKHFWETLLIDSKYFDDKYGTRDFLLDN